MGVFVFFPLFLLILGIGGALFNLFLYLIYKIDGGKMPLKKWWRSV